MSNSRALFELLGSGIMKKMHRGVKGMRSCLCSCTAQLCRRQEAIQDTAALWEMRQDLSALCTASCTGDPRLALLSALVPAADLSPAFSLSVPPKLFKNYLYYYYYFIIMRGEHMCTTYHGPCGEQRTAPGSFFSVESRIEPRFSGSQGKHSHT